MPAVWYYAKDGNQVGPVSAKQLKELADSGQLDPSHLVWKQGLDEWIEARRIKGLFQTSPVASGPASPSPPPLQASPASSAGPTIPPQKRVPPRHNTHRAPPRQQPDQPAASHVAAASPSTKFGAISERMDSLHHAIFQVIEGRNGYSVETPSIQRFHAEQARLNKEIAQLDRHLESLAKARVEYSAVISGEEAARREVEKQRRDITNFHETLGRQAFKGFVAGQINNHEFFAERVRLHETMASLEEEHTAMAPDAQDGFVQQAAAKAQQLVVAGKIKIESMKVRGLDRRIGEQLMSADRESEVECETTLEILGRIVNAKALLQTAEEVYENARADLEAKRVEFLLVFSIPNLCSTRELDDEQVRQTEAHSRLQESLVVLANDLVNGLMNERGQLGQCEVSRLLNDIEGMSGQCNDLPDDQVLADMLYELRCKRSLLQA